MTPAVLFVVLLFAASLAYIGAPLFRQNAAETERVASATSEEVDLHHRHDMILASLRDLEEDYVTGKLVEDDYSQLRAKLMHQAVDVMKKLDIFEEGHRKAADKKTLQHPGSKRVRTTGK